MAKIFELQSGHPLVGTWVSDEGDSFAEFTILPAPEGFSVTGVDRSDGERFQISDISWDGKHLRFTSVMPSTGYGAKHVLTLTSRDLIEHELTIFEVWKRKEQSSESRSD